MVMGELLCSSSCLQGSAGKGLSKTEVLSLISQLLAADSFNTLTGQLSSCELSTSATSCDKNHHNLP